MPFEGKVLQPSEIAALLHKVGFRDFDLVEMTATLLAESQGYVRAYNDNVDERTGKVKSRDVGLGQINIPARYVGTKREAQLYDPETNIRAVKALFDTRETLIKRRRFNPWYAFTLGWATFPEWWVFTKKEPRRWAPTGRYIHQAIVGVANFHGRHYGIDPSPLVALPEAPARPTKRPQGDGPRPVPNRGRGSLGKG